MRLVLSFMEVVQPFIVADLCTVVPSTFLVPLVPQSVSPMVPSRHRVSWLRYQALVPGT